MRKLVLCALAILSLVPAAPAAAAGGNYLFSGGTAYEQSQVTQALNASAFPWSIVPGQITIHIGRGATTEATPGEIWLDANLLHAGVFSWGTVQHEYAHQVDFFLLDSAKRQFLLGALGGKDWCYGVAGLAHAQYGCERFASTLAWAYWPDARNSMKPASPDDEAAAMKPAAFRALLASLIGAPDSVPPKVTAYAPPKSSKVKTKK